MAEQNMPLYKTSAGLVSTAVWENKVPSKNGGEVEILKATVQKRYKDKNGNWQSSNSFSRNDIPLAIYCLGKAFQAIIDEQSVNRNSDEVSEEIVI